MKPKQDQDGTWSVEDDTGYALASGLTNSQAWRFCDEANSETINSRESVHDWAFRMSANKQ